MSGADVLHHGHFRSTYYLELDIGYELTNRLVVGDKFFIDKQCVLFLLSHWIHLTMYLVQFDIDIRKVFSLHFVSFIKLQHNRHSLLLQNFNRVERRKQGWELIRLPL